MILYASSNIFATFSFLILERIHAITNAPMPLITTPTTERITLVKISFANSILLSSYFNSIANTVLTTPINPDAIAVIKAQRPWILVLSTSA
jgi:hypothetical protein